MKGEVKRAPRLRLRSRPTHRQSTSPFMGEAGRGPSQLRLCSADQPTDGSVEHLRLPSVEPSACGSPLHRLTAVPLPRKRERISGAPPNHQSGLLSRLRGRGTTRSVVEGGATHSISRHAPLAHQRRTLGIKRPPQRCLPSRHSAPLASRDGQRKVSKRVRNQGLGWGRSRQQTRIPRYIRGTPAGLGS
jgi:hypothetical protein